MTLHRLSVGQTVFGMPIIETDALPTYPSPAEEARRIVRNGLSDLTFGGKPIVEHGPGPRDATHGYVVWERSAWNPKLHASPQLVEELVIASRDRYTYSNTTLAELGRARAQCLYDRTTVEVYMAPEPDAMLEWARAVQARLGDILEWARLGTDRMLGRFDVDLEPWQQRWVEAAWRGEQYASFAINHPRKVVDFGSQA